jgi:hypothetical protein
MPLDELSLELLDKVKHGITAKYVLLTKGEKRILNLVVYRTGALETAKKQARTAGTGEFYHGIVDGGGQALSFKLARVDGFEEAPVKNKILKTFLAASNIDCKPTIDIVDTLPEMSGEGAPKVPPQAPQSPTATAPKQSDTAPVTAPKSAASTYRTDEQWDTILAKIAALPIGPVRKTGIEKTVAELKREREQSDKDQYMISDPYHKLELTNIHARVAHELKALLQPPITGGIGSTPQSPPQMPKTAPTSGAPKANTTSNTQSPPQGNVYRTQEQWNKILTTIGNAPIGPKRQLAIEKSVAELKREREQFSKDQYVMSDPNRSVQLTNIHAGVAQELKTLLKPSTTGGPAKQVPPTGSATPTGSTVPTNFTPSTGSALPKQVSPTTPTTGSAPPTRVPPQTPPSRPQKTADDLARDNMMADAKRRGSSLAKVTTMPYSVSDLKKLRTECETDEKSDFGKVTLALAVGYSTPYDAVVQRFQQAAQLAQKYINDHPDPKKGELLPRVALRRDCCRMFLPKIQATLNELQTGEEGAKAMAKSYGEELKKKKSIPSGVAEEMYKILNKTRLTDGTKAELQRVADEIRAADQPKAYSKLANMQNATDLQKAEILLDHGCFKSGGGTSDVRLLENQNQSIAFAFKGAQGEAVGSLSILDLPPGACATREDLCSTLSQDILAQTGIDFGFPKAQVAKLTGVTGALIDGIPGKAIDPEAFAELQSGTASQAKIDEMRKFIRETPDKVSAESLQKSLLFSTIACQWDCKWGNMMIENGTNARPIDGGGAFPNQACVDSFGRDYKVVPLPIMNLTQYPVSSALSDKNGQSLPQALQPMDAEIVKGLLKLDVDKLTQTIKGRRDEITRNHPDLAPPPHTAGLVDDTSLDIVKASIKATQDILRQNPKQSLVDFATAYQNWWVKWINDNRGPNSVKYGMPAPDQVGATT